MGQWKTDFAFVKKGKINISPDEAIAAVVDATSIHHGSQEFIISRSNLRRILGQDLIRKP